jgi:hypothetical protein
MAPEPPAAANAFSLHGFDDPRDLALYGPEPASAPSATALTAGSPVVPPPTPPRLTEMFPVEVAARESLLKHVDTLAVEGGLSQAQLHARRREHVAMLRDTKIDPVNLGGVLYEAMTSAELAAKRGVAVDPARQHEETATARRSLRQSYGAERAERIERETEAFIAAHPRLARAVKTAGASAAVRLGLAEHVRKAKQL